MRILAWIKTVPSVQLMYFLISYAISMFHGAFQTSLCLLVVHILYILMYMIKPLNHYILSEQIEHIVKLGKN